MRFLHAIFAIFLHLDVHLEAVVSRYGLWTYGFLILIVFCETGLVVTPFLPGDSLLFAAGAVAALGSLNIFLLIGLLLVAAVTGDSVNYWIGHRLGTKAFTSGRIKFLKQKHLDRTHNFFQKYGGKAIVFARFVPIIRTIAPFVAGVGSMPYRGFFVYNIVGATAWISLFTLTGYFFGNLSFVKEHFSIIIILIILISILPTMIEYVRSKEE